MKGERILRDMGPHELTSGQYMRWNEDGKWYAVPPGTTLLAGLEKHEVEEHQDRTITVSPSIEVSSNDQTLSVRHWHGFLVHGVWSEA